MYLADFQLAELCEKQGLVSPYDPARVNPASIDLTLGTDFVNISDKEITYYNDFDVYDGIAQPGDRFEATALKLLPGVALLATTAERVKIPDSRTQLVGRSIDVGLRSPMWEVFPPLQACIGELRLKSSAARNGLDHALAGWIDPGFDGTLTLELHSHRPIELLAGKAYVQLVVAAMLATPSKSYQQTGRYVGEHAQGAVLSRG